MAVAKQKPATVNINKKIQIGGLEEVIKKLVSKTLTPAGMKETDRSGGASP